MDENETKDVVEVRSALPSAETARDALDTYISIQKVFDEKMPDAIMEIQGKKFRKKSYWRGIANAFSVSCEVVDVQRVHVMGDDDWGYEARVRATSNDGRVSDGDGACMASEKSGASATVHNVRSHAVTRAKNRAISDLVGFGEVSADELGPDAYRNPPPAQEQAPSHQPKGKAATDPQRKKLYAVSMARADTLLDKALELKITPKIQAAKDARDEIARLAKERVGCGEIILMKEIDPLLAAIELVDHDSEGVLCYVGAVS